MTLNYYIIMGNTQKAKHSFIAAFLFSFYIAILIFNVYRTVRHTTKTTKQLLYDFKHLQDWTICVICRFCYRLTMARYSYRKKSTFTHVHSSLIQFCLLGISHNNIIIQSHKRSSFKKWGQLGAGCLLQFLWNKHEIIESFLVEAELLN